MALPLSLSLFLLKQKLLVPITGEMNIDIEYAEAFYSNRGIVNAHKSSSFFFILLWLE